MTLNGVRLSVVLKDFFTMRKCFCYFPRTNHVAGMDHRFGIIGINCASNQQQGFIREVKGLRVVFFSNDVNSVNFASIVVSGLAIGCNASIPREGVP